MTRLETLQKLKTELEEKLQQNGYNSETQYTIEVVQAEIKRIQDRKKEIEDKRNMLLKEKK